MWKSRKVVNLEECTAASFRGSVNISGTRCLRLSNLEMGDKSELCTEDTFVAKEGETFATF